VNFQSIVGAFLSDRQKAKIRTIQAAISFVRTGGTIADRECNVCGYKGPFYPWGLNLRRDAACPRCHSFERHRLFALWLNENLAEIKGKHVLHFAPEKSVKRIVETISGRYVTADLMDTNADMKLDIENIGMKDAFDVVIASHVLEHVDDRKALHSIYESLRPNGILLAMTPIIENMRTFEDASITDPKQRELYFGQNDHVRYFGGDFDRRLQDAGFSVLRFTPEEPFISRYSLMRGETLFICRKQ
jgi:SAM-dependent methyltransferase